ncbi:iron-containing alcohol dehydrogenase family protein [Anaerosinus massiliensis]|uniref:iron-containing alcohol dehydrogenase family protein n=1 Tax=Massilibacillus massiliensis TaxID=1806837 RepID=UPI000B30EC7D|nr:iron-containing alcohol dehydrogenase family protein [Massilibacillus massiliensis]
MSEYSVIFPSYTIGEEAYDKVKDVCPRYGTKVVAIGGKTAISKVKNLILQAIEGTSLDISEFLWFGGEASYENVEKLKAHTSVQDADMIFAIGGGKAIDTCKILAHALGKPFFTFPTISSNCACLTSLGVVYHPNGTYRELSFSKIPPVHAFICTKIAAEAPKQFLWAGMGDTVAKFYEAGISARNVELDHSNAIGVVLSQMCADPIVKYGEKALKDNEAKHVSYELEQVMLAIVVSTGMVSNFVVQDYNGHIAHALFAAITMLPQIEEKHLHGEVVAYGVLVLLMCDKQKEELKRIFDFFKSVGLPTKLADLDVSLDEMDAVLAKTEQSPELVRTPYKVTKQMLHDAVVALEEYNH